MDHPTPHPLFPCLAPGSKLLQQIAALRKWLDQLSSFVCKTALVLIPVLFAAAHIAADGVAWNFATGEKFSPMFNVVSSYAWRSPAGWAIVGCMVGFAMVLGFISWHAMKRGPGFLAWFTAVVAAIALFKTLEVAWYPIKPDRETFHEIQRELNLRATTERTRQSQTGSGTWLATDLPLPDGTTSPEYFKSLRLHWLHQQSIGQAQVLILLALLGAGYLWQGRRVDFRFWRRFRFWADWMVLLMIGAGLLGRVWLPEFNGMTQRVTYVGIYLWLLVIVREIERPSATVTDTPLQS